MSVPYKSNVERPTTECFMRIVEAPSSLDDPANAEDDHILECLGAAVIMRWGALPTKIQRELFEDATSLADLGETAELKGKIARFLHHRGDGSLRTTRTIPSRTAT